MSGENILGPSKIVDKLILAVGEWQSSTEGTVFVYDGYWQRSQALYNEVKRASWDKVILDENMKNDLTGVTDKFFDSKDVYVVAPEVHYVQKVCADCIIATRIWAYPGSEV
jgi:transitional endoplasmic reticulum ATPase